MDTGQKLTDDAMDKLEKRIDAAYRKAYDGLGSTIQDYFDKFTDRDEEERARMDAGEITPEEYRQWRLNQIGRGKRYEALRDRIAERMTNVNETANAYVNDATPGIYSLNRNYAAYTIENVAGDVGFDLWDEQTVKRLIVEQPELMPYYPAERALKRGIDLEFGKKQITASVTSSILQGKSIKNMADDLQNRIVTMGRNSAIRTARTAVTGAQNAGRLDSYYAAEKMGIKCKKEWMATLDNRTRHSHAKLDGEVVDNDKKFSNGCRFPGDPNGPPAEIYNCRCTLVSAIDGIDTSSGKRRARNLKTGKNEVIENMTYQQWEAKKKAAGQAIEDQTAKAERQAKLQEARDAIKQSKQEIEQLRKDWRNQTEPQLNQINRQIQQKQDAEIKARLDGEPGLEAAFKAERMELQKQYNAMYTAKISEFRAEVKKREETQIANGKKLIENLNETFTVHTDNEDLIKTIIDLDVTNGIKYNEVKRLSRSRTVEEIISAISGGDQTIGSCASAGLAYIGQKNGYDVLDFRDGQSREWFSYKSNKKKLLSILGIASEEEDSMKSSVANGHKMLKAMEAGHEYYVSAGRHAAIVRKNADKSIEYLELQSGWSNGWKTFTTKKPSYWEQETLIERFGCSKSSQYYSAVTWTDTAGFKDSDELRLVMGYINTPEGEQRKGNNGSIK